MGNRIKLMFVVLGTLICTSCASVKIPQDGSEVKVNLAPREYEMLDEVVYTGTTKSILGLFTWGGASHYELNWIAKQKYGADDVINVSTDITCKVYLLFYIKYDYVMRGIAIKYKK